MHSHIHTNNKCLLRECSQTQRNKIFKYKVNKKHLKNVEPIRHCEPPHAHSPGVASGTVMCRLRIDVHDIDNNNDDNT